MNAFDYQRASTLDEALHLAAAPGAQVIAGGMDLVPLLNDELTAPTVLIDISRLPDLNRIDVDAAHGLHLGALATLSQIMHDPQIQAHYPVLSRAITESASGQIRNMATIGGNLLQQPRCPYYRDHVFACLRRDGGDQCSALAGETERMAIFATPHPDTRPHCVAVHPSDAVNALAAIDAAIQVRGPAGERAIPIADFFADPRVDSTRRTVLEHGAIITGITAPPPPVNAHGDYVKVRDRAAYAFAIVSAAAVVAVEGAVITHARFAVGGVTWGTHRVPAAETALLGGPATPERFAEVASMMMDGAEPLAENAYKITMAHAALRRALAKAARLIP